MRRRFAMAVGGCLAVAAAGTAQQVIMTQQQQTPLQAVSQDRSYRSPFLVGSQPGPAMTMQPAAQSGMVQPVQYIPVQPIQSYMLPAPQSISSATPVVAPQSTGETQMAPTMTTPVYGQATLPAINGPIQYLSMQPVPAQPAQARPAAPAQPPAPGQMIQGPMNNAAPLATNGQGCPVGGCNSGAANACNACRQNNCQTCQPNCCTPCGPDGCIWVDVEYLLWWTQGTNTPPLVTASPPGTPRNNAGVLGVPGTTVLYGGKHLDDGTRSGVRVRFGGWLDDCRTCGLEASYFILGNSTNNFTANGGIIGRPFLNSTTGQQDAELVNYPNTVMGSVSVNNSTGLTGFDTNFRKNLRCDCCSRTDFIVGFRYLKLDDDLTISEDLLVTGSDPAAVPAPGTRFTVIDSFQTRNEFYGPQFGLAGEMRRGAMFMTWRGLVALGTTHKEVNINGSTTITQPNGAPTTYTGGFYALPTNIGNYSKNDFAVIPELNLNVGYQVNCNFRVYVGYSVLYWSNVTRAGDVIDTTINPTQLPPGTLVGQARPAFTWHDSDYWAHGFNFGAEFRY
jgi:Putative beta barrel porin-7 (BBP7)